MKKKITKTEFIKRVTSRPTIFVALLSDGKEIEPVKQRIKNRVEEAEPRTCVAKSGQHLVFKNSNGESHLCLADVKPHTKIECFDDGEYLLVETTYTETYYGFEPEVSKKILMYKEV